MAVTKRGQTAQVLVFACAKGGTGKTTLAAAIAARASQDGRTAVLDVDPQGSISRWHQLRGSPVQPALLEAHGDVAATVERARRDGFAYIVVDTPPALLGSIDAALVCADLIVIPVTSSPLDIENVEPIVEVAKREERPFVFVMNRVEPRSKLTEGAVRYLKVDGKVLAEQVGNRESFRAAMVSGKSGAEVKDDKAREEIEALWKALRKQLATVGGR